MTDSTNSQNEAAEDILPRNARKTSEWITVLSARGIDYALAHQDGQWRIAVPADVSTQARAEIAAYEEDERLWADRRALEADMIGPSRSLSEWWVVGFLTTFYLWFGSYESGSPLLPFASADSTAILEGREWWRLATALTLHSGPVHLMGNLLCVFFLGRAVCDIFGAGTTWITILGSGLLGNILACLAHGPGHVSVGASTAGFGAVGILTMHEVVRICKESDRSLLALRRAGIPFGAGVAITAMLGTGPRSDLAAHLFGFAAGLVLCLPALPLKPHRDALLLQRVLQIAALFVMMMSWRLVLRTAQ